MRVVINVTKEDIKTTRIYHIEEGPITLAAQRKFKQEIDWAGVGVSLMVGAKVYEPSPKAKTICDKSWRTHGKIKPCRLVFTQVSHPEVSHA